MTSLICTRRRTKRNTEGTWEQFSHADKFREKNMPAQSWLVLILLVSIFALIASDKLPPWVVFLGALTVAMTLQLALP